MRDASVKDAVDQFRKNKNGQVVLVLQGGGALGAYQVGVSIKLCMRISLRRNAMAPAIENKNDRFSDLAIDLVAGRSLSLSN